jgi:hypothetical protein
MGASNDIIKMTMSRTPEELAEEFADDRYCPFGERERWEDAKTGYPAGYQAAQVVIEKELQ